LRNPSAHRSLIAFAVWSSFAHPAIMSALGFEIASQRVGLVVASAVLVVIGIVLVVLAPRKQTEQPASVPKGKARARITANCATMALSRLPGLSNSHSHSSSAESLARTR